jgi:soluble lytic murein transglycosylase
MAVPRIALHDADEVGLPQPLSPSEAVQIRRIFALQASGAFAEAARETDRLDTAWMLGPILADRYLNAAYHPTQAELTIWLADYGDEPEATSIRAVLRRLAPNLPASGAVEAVAAPTTPPPHPVPRQRIRSLFVQNHDAATVAAATPLLRAPTSVHNSDALFTAGLAAWRLDQLPTARSFFTAAYHAADTAASRAAAAFWLARVEQREENRGDQTIWLRRAAQEHDTFYGHLARRALDPSPACFAGGTIGDADIDTLLATPQGRRAFALLQIGERRRAETELRALWLDTRPDASYGRALVLVARAVGLSQFAEDVQSDGLAEEQAAGQRTLPRLRPNGGFVVDPPLVYALVRHESNFQTGAVSQAGARGLMQIMPNTAAWMGALPAGQAAERLHDPAVNLAVGQRYLMLLSEDSSISGNLLRLLAAYAQGPANMKRWADTVNDGGDPLMFMEAIPNPAITAYVEAALVTAWDYAAAMHLPAATLDALEANDYPHLVRANLLRSIADGRSAVCPRG